MRAAFAESGAPVCRSGTMRAASGNARRRARNCLNPRPVESAPTRAAVRTARSTADIPDRSFRRSAGRARRMKATRPPAARNTSPRPASTDDTATVRRASRPGIAPAAVTPVRPALSPRTISAATPVQPTLPLWTIPIDATPVRPALSPQATPAGSTPVSPPLPPHTTPTGSTPVSPPLPPRAISAGSTPVSPPLPPRTISAATPVPPPLPPHTTPAGSTLVPPTLPPRTIPAGSTLVSPPLPPHTTPAGSTPVSPPLPLWTIPIDATPDRPLLPPRAIPAGSTPVSPPLPPHTTPAGSTLVQPPLPPRTAPLVSRPVQPRHSPPPRTVLAPPWTLAHSADGFPPPDRTVLPTSSPPRAFRTNSSSGYSARCAASRHHRSALRPRTARRAPLPLRGTFRSVVCGEERCVRPKILSPCAARSAASASACTSPGAAGVWAQKTAGPGLLPVRRFASAPQPVRFTGSASRRRRRKTGSRRAPPPRRRRVCVRGRTAPRRASPASIRAGGSW